MSDWEDDWENDNFEVKLPATSAPAAPAAPARPDLADYDANKFADEEEEEDEVNPRHQVVGTQEKKKVTKKYTKGTVVQDEPLDDPVAEKLRQQRLIEEADFKAAQELFGGSDNPMDGMIPKSEKDFEEYATALFSRYILPHRNAKLYKYLAKKLVSKIVEPLDKDETKDVETSVAGIRAKKVKQEKEAAALAKKKSQKAQINVGGGSKGGKTAGLDDHLYNDGALDDDYDFM